MADTIAIVLEYLLRHRFTKAEAALRSELLARQGTDNSLLPSSGKDSELNSSLLADSGREEFSTCHESFFQEPWHQNFHSSYVKAKLKSGSSCEEQVKVEDLDIVPEVGGKSEPHQHFLHENSKFCALQANELEPQLEKPNSESVSNKGYGSLGMHQGVLLCSYTENALWQPGDNVNMMIKAKVAQKKGRITGKMEDTEPGLLSESVELQRIDDCNNGISGRRIVSQKEKKEVSEPWQSNMYFQSSRVLEGPSESPLKKSRSAKVVLQTVEFLDESDSDQKAIQALGKASGRPTSDMDRWEDLSGLSLYGACNDSVQPDIGAPQLEKATIVHKSGAYFLENRPVNFNEGATIPGGFSLSTHYKSSAGESYGALTGNGWLEHDQSKDGLPKQLDKGAVFKMGYPYFLCSSDEQASIQIQEEKQVDTGREVQRIIPQGKEMETGPRDFLEESALPWEVNFSSKRDRMGGFEHFKSSSGKTDGELPRLPQVRLRSMDKNLDNFQAKNGNHNFEIASTLHFGSTNNPLEPSFEMGSYLDIPLGQDINSSGSKLLSGSSRPSVSQGIVEDAPELLSGFTMLGDGPGDSGIGYPHEYWDSDGYEDDDDPGYHRQPIEDEAWFLAHEIDHPSDDDRPKLNIGGKDSRPKKELEKLEDDDHSFMEEDSYFSGEQFYRLDQNEARATLSDGDGINMADFYGKAGDNNLASFNQIGSLNYDGKLMDVEELKLMRTEPVWQGFVAHSNQAGFLSREKIIRDISRSHEKDSFDVADDRQGSVRSGGAGLSSDIADFESEVRESLPGGSSEGDDESVQDSGGYGTASSKLGQDHATCSQIMAVQDALKHSGEDVNEHDTAIRCNEDWNHKTYSAGRQVAERNSDGLRLGTTGQSQNHLQIDNDTGGFGFGGFCFPSPSSTGDMPESRADSGRENTTLGDDMYLYGNGMAGPDDTLASWKRKSNESSPIISPREKTLFNLASSAHSTVSAHSTDDYLSRDAREDKDDEAIGGCVSEGGEETVVDDEETAAIQEQIRQIKAEEDEYEVFNLRIIHRRNRTGFEEDKNFPVVINSVIAGRYHVTEYLGSAAFSKAIQAHDLQTGLDVCMKIIKNNKDFFDQSLDEVKLLKYINRHDPSDKYHILRLYDYFYYREHLFIVCELLRANLYEFHKFNRESGGEVYFTMPRLQSITRQCLEALEFLHNLGLIHCDLKPENILIKSYSRCEVKVIDLGSSCFQTDHLCPYVQSRSYRAPEVILGLPYNQKIDIWSLGCILAELCSGNVLFQNDSLATLLARVVGIICPIDPEMLAKGRDTHKYFTKNHMLYERNQDTNQLEHLLPKKTSLRHRLSMGDQGFVDFVGYLLQINPENRPSATEALKHPWLSYPYEPISS